MIREEIKKIEKMGRMPNESLNDDASIDKQIEQYDELLQSIVKPISLQEGEVLIKIFPENSFYDLQWTLLHLVESLFGKIDNNKYQDLIKNCPSVEWKETLNVRLNNVMDKI
ncbi:hypothetical protein [[Flexibacter] sp. ATCC 35103]|uniref:hypothetical protein n=1 Tax=[Flexibacter] sp. ATCC 35103 TaxID=1937528 RepID=UPI00210136A0|nr:hypothetical protein [[Flexibacter] sp. ATCC 35103]